MKVNGFFVGESPPQDHPTSLKVVFINETDYLNFVVYLTFVGMNPNAISD